MRVRSAVVVGALLIGLVMPAVASAHAQLLSSTPAVGQTLTSLPATILLTYDDVLTRDSSFTVLNSSGSTVQTGTLDPADAKSLSAAMPVLGDGAYEVRWTAISADDGFIERGSFTFKVALATGSPTEAPATPAATEVAPTPAPTGAGGASSGADVLVPIIAVVVLVIGGLAFFLRRRGAA